MPKKTCHFQKYLKSQFFSLLKRKHLLYYCKRFHIFKQQIFLPIIFLPDMKKRLQDKSIGCYYPDSLFAPSTIIYQLVCLRKVFQFFNLDGIHLHLFVFPFVYLPIPFGWVTFRPEKHLDPSSTQTRKALRPKKYLDPKALRPQKHLDPKSTQTRKRLDTKALRPKSTQTRGTQTQK